MKYRIEVQQIYGCDVADRANAEWLEIDRIKPRGRAAAIVAFDAYVAQSGFRPPIRLVALDANYRGYTVLMIANEWKPEGTRPAPQSFFTLHDMHFRAVDECIAEQRPFSFAEGTDCTGAPAARSTHHYNGESYIHAPGQTEVDRTARAEALAVPPNPVDFAFVTRDSLPVDYDARLSLALQLRSLLDMRASFTAHGRTTLVTQTNALIDALCVSQYA